MVLGLTVFSLTIVKYVFVSKIYEVFKSLYIYNNWYFIILCTGVCFVLNQSYVEWYDYMFIYECIFTSVNICVTNKIRPVKTFFYKRPVNSSSYTFPLTFRRSNPLKKHNRFFSLRFLLNNIVYSSHLIKLKVQW